MRLGVADHFLDVVAAPAAGGVGPAAIAERVNADRQISGGSSLIDRPVAALPEWFGRAAQQQHLGEVAVVGAQFDFLHRCGGILVGHHHGPAQAFVLGRPLGLLPLVRGMGDGVGQQRIGRALAAGQRVQDAQRHVVRVQMLLAP